MAFVTVQKKEKLAFVELINCLCIFLLKSTLPASLLCLLQVFAPAADVVELFIHLGEPCHVCQLLLMVAHGADDTSFPVTVDVRTGSSLDELKLVLEVCLTYSYFSCVWDPLMVGIIIIIILIKYYVILN